MIKDIVNGLIETYGAIDPMELCECIGIKTMFHADLGSEIKGFFQRTPDEYEIIHINSELTEQEQKYICAHELGHAIMHTDIAISFFVENSLMIRNKYEIEADRFAAYLLINEYEKEYIDSMNIQQLSAYFNVPERLIQYRFQQRR